MNDGPMRTLTTLAALALLPSVAHAAPDAAPAAAGAKKGPIGKAAPACGAKILPLVEGNVWTYEAVASPTPPRDDLARLSPLQPKKIVITVKSVAPKGTDTLVTLEEKVTVDLSKDSAKPKLDDHVVTSTITCNAKKFEISPDSFFFAGEPGGYLGLTFDKLDRSKDTSLKLQNGAIGEADWREDIIAHWTRIPTPGADVKASAGKLELERKFQPAQPETIVTKLGSYKAERLVLTTTGRVTLDTPTPTSGTPLSPMELPASWVNQLWLADAVGVVQVQNAFAHMYQLTDAQLK